MFQCKAMPRGWAAGVHGGDAAETPLSARPERRRDTRVAYGQHEAARLNHRGTAFP